jgi:hypothetical protein
VFEAFGGLRLNCCVKLTEQEAADASAREGGSIAAIEREKELENARVAAAEQVERNETFINL